MSIDFIYSNSSVLVQDAGYVNVDNQQPLTFCAWIYPRSGPSSGTSFSDIYAKAATGSIAGRGFLRITSSLGLEWFRAFSGANNLTVRTADSSITLNKWQHVAVVFSGNSTATLTKIYINGTEGSYATQSNASPGTPTDDSVSNLRIGNVGNYIQPLNGLITEIYLWGSAQLESHLVAILASSQLRRVGLNFNTLTGGLRFYCPMDDLADTTTATTSSIRDRSINYSSNNFSPANTSGGASPSFSSDSVLSYP